MNTNKKTVSISTAARRTAADAWDRARSTRLKKAKDAAKKGIDIRENGVVYLDDSMSPGERAAAVKSAMAAATFAIGDSKVINVLTGALALPKSYQRDPNEGKKRLLRTNFNMKKLNPLLVSYRDGVLLVLDGGHRLEIAIELGIPFLPVKVLEGLTIEEEATLFATQDDQKVTVKAAQKFKAGLVAKDQIASTIYAICDSYGLTVTNKPSGVDRPMKAITAPWMSSRIRPLMARTASAGCWALWTMPAGSRTVRYSSTRSPADSCTALWPCTPRVCVRIL